MIASMKLAYIQYVANSFLSSSLLVNAIELSTSTLTPSDAFTA